MPTHPSALGALTVLDLTDDRAIYGAKLLADMGARVVRPEPPGGDPLRRRGPHLEGGDGGSLWHAFFASNRRFVTVDPGASDGQEALAELVEGADVVLACDGALKAAAKLDEAVARRPELIVIDVSSFGPTGPWRDCLAPDLVAGALGGAVATTGDVDTPPLKTFGELNFVLSGAYAAIAVLAAVYRQRRTGAGQRGHVPVHECIASCLEHVLMWYWYHDRMPNAQGPSLTRRGSLHWSNAYVVMPAKGGSIMVTPTPSFDNQLVWLIENDAQQDLLDPKYQEPEHRRDYIRRIMQVLRDWVGTREVEEIFFDAQAHHAPYGWVLSVDKVAKNPQLAARDWWAAYAVDGRQVEGTGAPYRFSATPWRIDHAAADAADEPGPPPSPPSPCGDADRLPLRGLRILDFTHVLAGPFATRILADLGADVVKVNTATRAGPNAPGSVYYIMWNRNKRALALDMSRDEARSVCRRLCETADVVIDNFSVGVLDRWGVGYDAVSAANPKVIYVQMSGMGDGGPWSDFVTYAPTIHALSGLTYLTGVPGREDIGIGFSYNDHCAGLHGAFAILAGLEARRQIGRGQRIDMSQFEVGVNLAGPTMLDYFASGRAATPLGNRLPYDAAAPHNCYPCAGAPSENVADEQWVAIACMTDAQWQALRQLMGDPAWAQEARFEAAAGRQAAEDLDDRIAEWTRTLSAGDVMARCQAAGVPAGVVQTGADMGERDPQLRESGFLMELDEEHPVAGKVYADRLPIRFEGEPTPSYRRTRELGEDNAEVLQDWLGMSEEEVREGEEAGFLK